MTSMQASVLLAGLTDGRGGEEAQKRLRQRKGLAYGGFRACQDGSAWWAAGIRAFGAELVLPRVCCDSREIGFGQVWPDFGLEIIILAR